MTGGGVILGIGVRGHLDAETRWTGLHIDGIESPRRGEVIQGARVNWGRGV